MALQTIAGKICDEYAKKDSRITTIHKQNGGLSAARNSGSKIAKGEWITFVDADDWIELNTCELIYSKSLENNNLDVILYGRIRNLGNTQIKMKYDFEDDTIFDKEGCQKLQKNILNFNSNLSSQVDKFYNRKFIEKNKLYNLENLQQGAEGIEFNIRVFEMADKAMFVNGFLYHYRYNENSISSYSTEENNYLTLDCFKEIKKTLQKNEKYNEILPLYYNRLLYVIVTTAISGYFNPDNKENYKVKKMNCKKYLKNELVQEAFKYSTWKGIGIQRKIIIIFLKIKFFAGINILANIRKKQKSLKNSK